MIHAGIFGAAFQKATSHDACKMVNEKQCKCGRALEEMFLAKGARIGYWRGSIEGVAEDLQV